MQKVDEKLEELYERKPHTPKVKVQSGLRGTRYFIEFPVVKNNVDAYSLMQKTRTLMESNKKKYGVKVTGADSYLADENVSYLLDYKVDSPTIQGTKNSGTVYIRGIKGKDGWDSFKFILEKGQDFSDFDAELVSQAYEMMLGVESPPELDTSNMTPAMAKFAKRQAAQ
jgi:hypothetical protein